MAFACITRVSHFKDVLFLMKNKKLWLIWLILVVILMANFTYKLLESDDKTLFMPGELTSGHYQIGIACNACHIDSFSNNDDLQNACIECHGEQRRKPFDSHPREKFTDPRNADRLQNIDALYCVTCHVEHKPEIAQKTGLTQPVDFCVHCHKDVAKERSSHEGMGFETCASAGCHNYHNNRSLYTDFLVKHMDDQALLARPQVAEREFINVLDEVESYPHDKYPVTKLMLRDSDAPTNIEVTEEIKHDWLSTAHSKAGANCSSCHGVKTETEKEAGWNPKPDHNACSQCHDVEVKHFMQGKHGMRLQLGLSPMIPADARLPMKKEALNHEIGCNSCHQAHKYDLDTAAVESCLACHDDEHSIAYKDSPHYELWKKEQSGELQEGRGVSCATCHMPRVSVDVSDWLRRTVVMHNQNATLVPNEKMIRPACMNCHGLAFSIDSLADQTLIRNNFKGKPSIHIQSIDMARKDNERHLKETGGDTF